ncbi:MAG TPA: cadherin-like domain-containing protein [Nitrosopumilaceae archaeon]|nr:cadherin-like domain-containing protein [Nitrosopumilaceae archaeon]
MKKKAISFILILLASTLVFPIGGHSFAITLPVASNDSYRGNENKIIDIAAPGVLANDTAASGKTLFAGLVTNVKNGTLILNSNGGFVYVPNSNFHGIDSFRYVANDGTLSSNIANVTITIIAVNHLPVAKNDIYFVNENATLNIHGSGVLANDTDADGNTLTALLVSNVLNGVLTLNQNGSFTYTPHSNFHGMDSFTYKANDGTASSNVATVTVVVNQVNSTPTSNPLLQLIQQIQNLFAKITGIEQEINDLQAKNTALESRVTHLENLIQNSNHGTSGQNQTNIENQENNNEHDDKNKHNDNHQDNKND